MISRKTKARTSQSSDLEVFQQLFSPHLSKAQIRQVAIAEAAIAIYVLEGIERATFERIAEACDVSRPLIIHYFKEREKLFEFVIKYIRLKFQQMAIEAIGKADSAESRLKAYVDICFYWAEKFPQHAKVWGLYYYYCGIKDHLRALNTQLVEMGQQRIMAILRSDSKHAKTSDSDLLLKAKLIQVLVTGALISVLTEDMAAVPQFATEITDQCLKITNL